MMNLKKLKLKNYSFDCLNFVLVFKRMLAHFCSQINISSHVEIKDWEITTTKKEDLLIYIKCECFLKKSFQEIYPKKWFLCKNIRLLFVSLLQTLKEKKQIRCRNTYAVEGVSTKEKNVEFLSFMISL